MDILFLLTVAAIIVVLVFDYTNGFHDVSNIVATMIASGAMSARRALLLAAIFEFLGPLLGGTAVADTVGKLVNTDYVVREMGRTAFTVKASEDEQGRLQWRVQVLRTGEVRLFDREEDLLTFLRQNANQPGFRYGRQVLLVLTLAAVLAAILWNLITWYLGIPSSSSHALVGGLLGATLIATRHSSAIHWGLADFTPGHAQGVIGVVLALFLSPLLGLLVGYFLQRLVAFMLRWATPQANIWLRRLQWFTASALAFSHGTNDAQKSMGVIALVLLSSGYLSEFHVPLWVKAVCALTLALGAMSGGWRIMKTVGRGIFRLRPVHGFCSQFASAAVIFGHALLGGPVSTTHVVSSTVAGVGAAERREAVRWGKMHEILVAWLLTLPAAAGAGAVFYLFLSPLARMGRP
ncbi:MAG TPA: inorganic phosphate transporter [Armatimonadetes bacterium]|nr:inorganic phosphate transporter [Armatimonadota bacterium]